MVSLRLSIFVHAILFMLLHSLAYSLQDTKKMMMMITRDKIHEGTLLSEQKNEIFNAIPASTELVAKTKMMEGRKMMKIISEGHINEEKTVSWKQSSSSFSTSNARTGVHKISKKSKKIGQQDHQVKAKMSSTIMFSNADYYVPRSHPPRHN